MKVNTGNTNRMASSNISPSVPRNQTLLITCLILVSVVDSVLIGCYSTQSISSSWAWRIPSLLQLVPSVLAFLILFVVPELPRWLISRDRHEEALGILKIVNNVSEDEVKAQYREIADAIELEKLHNLSLTQAFSTKPNRRRLLITSAFSIIVMLPGTNIVTYYFGDMMANAGITDSDTQLQINIVLTSWTLVIAVAASLCADKLGRKSLRSLSLLGQIITLFLLGGFTKPWGRSTKNSGISATLALIF